MTLKKIALMVMCLFPSLSRGAVVPLQNHLVHPADQNPMGSACEHTTDQLRCVQFLYNHDGDTFTVRVPDVHPLLGEKISVRVAGIDAPELYSSDLCERNVAIVSQRYVNSILSRARRIDLVALQRDKYFRILADVRVDEENLSQMLLNQGLAYPYDGGAKKKINWCDLESPIAL